MKELSSNHYRKLTKAEKNALFKKIGAMFWLHQYTPGEIKDDLAPLSISIGTISKAIEFNKPFVHQKQKT